MLRRTNVRSLLLMGAMSCLACGGGGSPTNDSETGSTDVGSTDVGSTDVGSTMGTSSDEPGTTLTSTSAATGDSTGDTADPGESSTDDGTNPPPRLDCDVWQQDCPPGEKCVPEYETDGSLAATRCLPIGRDAAPGGLPCNPTAGGDDGCDATALCIANGDGSGGTCVPLCGGDPRAPTCDAPGASCYGSDDGGGVCIEPCDPLAAACPRGQACFAAAAQLLCLPLSEDAGGAGEACELVNDCQAGHQCVPARLQPSCGAASCCAAWCDPELEMPCADPAASCLPYAPAGDPGVGLPPQGVCVTR